MAQATPTVYPSCECLVIRISCGDCDNFVFGLVKALQSKLAASCILFKTMYSLPQDDIKGFVTIMRVLSDKAVYIYWNNDQTNLCRMNS